ncbi:hypothetical protein ACFLVX_01750 [Chloroflexota bacterium]
MVEHKSQYRCPFLNQYLKIPKNILDRINAAHPMESESIRHCLGLIVVNLLTNVEVAYSRDKNFYTENRTRGYTWTNMRKAVDIAEEKGYAIKSQKGYWNRDFEKGLSSTLSTGPRLEEFGPPEEAELDIESLPLLSVDGKPVFDNIGLAVQKAHSGSVRLETRTLLARLDSVYSEALRLNREYWNPMEIDHRNVGAKEQCLSRVGLTRVFKEGEVGRWFQRGGLSYQELSEEARTKLLLNSKEVMELDYHAMHPHIMYAWEGKQCPDDFYERVMSLSGCSRFVAKSVILIAVNARSYRSVIGAINLDRGRQARANEERATKKPILYDELKKSKLHTRAIIESVKETHPALAKYIYSGAANRLMLEESDIMTSVLIRLMELSIPTLPVHDSIIAPVQHATLVKHIMEDVYSQHTGFRITVD